MQPLGTVLEPRAKSRAAASKRFRAHAGYSDRPRFSKKKKRASHLSKNSDRTYLRFWRLTSAAILAVALVYGASLGGQFQRITYSTLGLIDNALLQVGFATENVEITGLDRLTRDKVIRAIANQKERSIWGFSITQAQSQLQQLSWVRTARIKRLLPSTVHIEIQERVPAAIWQIDGEQHLIDSRGKLIEHVSKRVSDTKHLPLIVGRGAPEQTSDILSHVFRYPQLTSQLKAMIRVADRRWNIALKSGLQILLPERRIGPALRQLAELNERRHILQKQLVSIDLRVPGRVSLRRGASPANADDPIARQIIGEANPSTSQADDA